MRPFIVSSILVLGVSGAVNAQHAANTQDVLEEIVVTTHPLSREGLAQSIVVLSGKELAEKVRGSIGETVAGEPGVSSASFGSAVGRPIIHGLGGARVKTTEDRIDTLDVSVTSGDHAVTIEPFIADQIVVLKGASTLLYGSNAIGGVVDVGTGRIPKRLPEQAVTGRVEIRGSDNANATNGAARLDGSIGENIAWHVDAFGRDADDYDIPGFARSAAERAVEAEQGSEEEQIRGRLPGSALDNYGGAVGFSYVGERGFAGFSVSSLDANYGLVGAPEEEEEEESVEGVEEAETGMIDMDQTRLDLEAQLDNPFAGFDSINFRFGINDYQHGEIEANGELGTLFENDAWEGRLQATHAPIAGFTGTVGLQLNHREFSAIGEEAFVPPTTTDSGGIFWVGERNFDRFDIETGFRFERTEHEPTGADLTDLDFNTGSFSLGFITPLNDALKMSALLDYSSRAPTQEELFSNGPHLATSSFEIGDPSLEEETATQISVTANYFTDLLEITSTVYYTAFDDFIFEANNGQIMDGLPVFVYQQDDADFVGIDIKADIHLAELADGDLDLSLVYDAVRAELSDNNEDLPRIPADRFGIALQWSNSVWDTKLGYQRVSAQNEIAEFEFPTDAYDDFSLYLGRNFAIGENDLSVFLHGRNLSDDEQRNSASIVKEFAPAPGRTFEFGLRMQF